ncbi:hypothetical protein TREMEDRAFT_60544 [Tremella mesenterica DSM 1558]|uniref:uncharacterized protein n=1 Tax=Tremella mesenterica (strain ATCC 24925 / CBS 8224 / DSM 1558 / NBRC 9311 / NRRL Y-6157 / RJB 2259-6 / UBC 559-6) TaxID=578456 RepID=UPI0003F495E7|nr:uncharacterized protein TREMEDRAFT_60544 [Tremella mesenterica DSM 1558]EIW71622.1 hypothetical protein TREMEDRAFT_60544 [Tremella mesenterica DSM 1558]
MDELTDELDQSFQNEGGAIDDLMDFQEHESPPLPPTITPPPPPTSPAPSIRSSRNVETDSSVDNPTQRAMVGRSASPLSNSLPPATTEGRGSVPSVQNTTANDIGLVDMPGDDPATSQNSVQIIATPVRHSRSPEAPESHGVRNEDDETMRPSDLEADRSEREITPLQKIENDEIHRESLRTGGVAGTRDDSEPQSKRRKRGDAQKERERLGEGNRGRAEQGKLGEVSRKHPSNSDLSLSSSISSRQTRASTVAILPDVDPELLMRQTKRMRITSQAPVPSQPPLVDASRRALDTIKDRYQSGPSRDQQSSLLDDEVIEQYIDFEAGAGPSTTGENPSPAKSVESEHGTIVENQNSPGNKSPVPPSDSEGLVEVPHELETIFHAPRKVPVNDELAKALDARKDSEIGEISTEFSTLWARLSFSSVRHALKDEALDRFRETGAIKPTVKWFGNALDRLAQGWRLRNKNGAVVRLEGELCSDCQRRLDGGEDFRVGCIGPRNFKVFGENQQSRVQISRGIYLLPSNLVDVDVKGITVGAQTVTSKVTFVLEHELCAASARYRSLSSQDQSSSLTQLSAYIHLFSSLLLPLPPVHLGLYKSLHLIPSNYAPPSPSETLDHLTSAADPTGLTSSQPVAGPSSSPHTPLPRNVIRIPASVRRPRANSTTSNF